MLSAQQANRRYFRQAYRSGQHGWAVEEPSAYAVAFLKRLKRQVPSGKLLDLGCGEGRHAILAAKLGFRVTAIDYEPLALKAARHFAQLKQVRRIAFRKADVFSLPFRTSSFDIILDYGCLHHQRTVAWPAYKASILRLLKSDGFYILSVFSRRFRLFRGSRRRWHIAYGAYRRWFSKREIHEMFAGNFELLDMCEQRGRGGGFWHVLMKKARKPNSKIRSG